MFKRDKRDKIETKPALIDVTVRMAKSDYQPTFACVKEVKRHTQELEIVQCDGRHTFINACDYTTYWYTKD